MVMVVVMTPACKCQMISENGPDANNSTTAAIAMALMAIVAFEFIKI